MTSLTPLNLMFRLLLLSLVTTLSMTADAEPLKVGSKKFTENVILGDVACLKVRAAGLDCAHRRELGGTQVLYGALKRGDIDVYPEYTGTIVLEILGDKTSRPTPALLKKELDKLDLQMSAPLGFSNTYALGLTKARAKELQVGTISDLRKHPDLKFRFSSEFLNRTDGWLGLKRDYSLRQTDLRGMDHDLAYRGLNAGSFDVMDLYSTDAEVAYYDLTILEDDRKFFPPYAAVYLYRNDVAETHAKEVAALQELGGKLDTPTMAKLNAKAKIERVPEAEVAATWLNETFGIVSKVEKKTRAGRIAKRTLEHLQLVVMSLLAAIFVALPLGILAARRKSWGQVILSVTGVVQTIPSLALLVFMIPLVGIGTAPATIALFLYSLLPIVRNTFEGLNGIDRSLMESAQALGLPAKARLLKIELPLASRSILAGIKTSAVINVGTATLGALVGAGGYGQPILTGIRLDSVPLIMEGAVPAAVLALLTQWAFDFSERFFVPAGIRAEAARS